MLKGTNLDNNTHRQSNHLQDHLGYNDDHLSRPAITTMYTTTTPPSQPTQSTSKRAVCQISGGAPDDRGQQAADAKSIATNAQAKARSTKAQMKANEFTKLLSEQYNDRDDIAITPADMPEIKVCVGATSRLKSVCGVDITILPLKALRVIFTKESIPRFSYHSKKEICDILVELKIHGKANAYNRKAAKLSVVSDKGTPNQEHQHATTGGDSSSHEHFQPASPAGLQPSSPVGLQPTNPVGELMILLQAKLERLRKSQKVAHDVGLIIDDVKEYKTKIKEVEKEIDDLEDAKIDQLRRDAAAAAAADNH
jgi:hypothetical protein